MCNAGQIDFQQISDGLSTCPYIFDFSILDLFIIIAVWRTLDFLSIRNEDRERNSKKKGRKRKSETFETSDKKSKKTYANSIDACMCVYVEGQSTKAKENSSESMSMESIVSHFEHIYSIFICRNTAGEYRIFHRRSVAR